LCRDNDALRIPATDYAQTLANIIKLKKGILIGLGIVLSLVLISLIFIRLAFGPLHDSVIIDLGTEGQLICDETYNGDFADEFYEVKMILRTLNGKKYDLGSLTFHNQDWNKRIITKRVGDWIVFPLEPEGFVQFKMLNTVTGQLNDSTLHPFDLRKDLLYKKKFKDTPNHLYSGSSSIQDISGNIIEVDYEYKAEAMYPPEILVNQKVVYEISPTDGKLKTKELHDRVVQ
jgi:hypothetical protein